MGRALRAAAGGMVYHVLNRSNARARIFDDEDDYATFEHILGQAHERVAMRTLAYCVMPDHWHLVLWPRRDGDLSDFVRWLTLTHTQRWHAYHGSAGTGHVYQGRFKSFPIQSDEHLLLACRYVERNALRAKLVRRAQAWRWCSLWRRLQPDDNVTWLTTKWPIARPSNWTTWLNQPQSESELASIRRCVVRGCPFGADRWVRRTARRYGLLVTLRPRGRPARKRPKGPGGAFQR